LAYDECDLDLSGVSQVAVTGPVGAGKSSIVEAITWALWGEARGTVMDSVIRDGALACSVRIEALIAGHALSVSRTKTRGRDSTLALELDGHSLTRHTQRETLAEVVRLAGLSYQAALAGPLMMQGDTGALMRLRPAERKEVLLGLYGLERFAVWEDAAKAKRDDATLTVRSGQTMIASMGDLGAALLISQEHLNEVAEKIETLTEAVIFGRDRVSELTERTAGLKERTSHGLSLKRQLDEARTKFANSKALLEGAEATLVEAKMKANSVAVADLVAPEPVAIEEAEEAARAAAKAHAQVFGALADLRAHVRAMQGTQEVTCPECGAGFKPGVSNDDLVQAQADLDNLIVVENTAAHVKADAEAEAKRLRSEQTMAMAQRSRRIEAEAEVVRWQDRVQSARAMLDELSEQGKRLRAEVEGYEEVGPELTAALDELASARGALANNEEALREVEADAVRTSADMERTTREAVRRKQLQAEVDAAMAEAVTFGLLAKAFHRDGIPTYMLERGLPLIEERANEVLARMPGDFAVRLVTQRLTTTMKAQERLDVVVEVAGVEREYEKLSGGQKFRVDLALRLGLTRAVGSSFDTLLIDETLDRFQDSAGREALLESLSAISGEFGLVFVISHHPDIQDRFENRIEVTMEDGVSQATLV
jgi:DNA repair exonuclease SbcCD ATPase subunit